VAAETSAVTDFFRHTIRRSPVPQLSIQTCTISPREKGTQMTILGKTWMLAATVTLLAGTGTGFAADVTYRITGTLLSGIDNAAATFNAGDPYVLDMTFDTAAVDYAASDPSYSSFIGHAVSMTFSASGTALSFGSNIWSSQQQIWNDRHHTYYPQYGGVKVDVLTLSNSAGLSHESVRFSAQTELHFESTAWSTDQIPLSFDAPLLSPDPQMNMKCGPSAQTEENFTGTIDSITVLSGEAVPTPVALPAGLSAIMLLLARRRR
jgi:hypothetical protein